MRTDLAEIPAAPQIRQHQFAPGMRFRYLHESQAHQVKTVGDVALMANDIALAEFNQLHSIPQKVDESLCERCEHGHAAQMIFERALLIIRIELGFERLVALDDVQHVAQHFEHHAVGGRPHCRRARVQAHACHFAEQIARV